MLGIDFETYSEAGYQWDDAKQRWAALDDTAKRGLEVVGAATYAEHPSTDVLTMSYERADGSIARWRPGLPNPKELFDHVAAGGLLRAWNSQFEYWIWNRVCARWYGWPPLPLSALRCTMARARAHGLPGKLGEAARVMNLPVQKDTDGVRLLNKFSKPRNPTKGDPRRRIVPVWDAFDPDAERLAEYCDTDVRTESAAAARLPELDGEELAFWLADQAINIRGFRADLAGVADCIALVHQAHAEYNAELMALTGVDSASKIKRMQVWLAEQGVHLDSLDADHTAAALAGDLPLTARRALEIRAAIGSAAVKKLFAMRNQVSAASRLHGLFSYHAAHTGRATGNGPQPTNLPNGGPRVAKCDGCGGYQGLRAGVPINPACPWCGVDAAVIAN